MRKRTDPTALAFEALTIEGGLLAPAILTRVAQLEAGEQAATDYRVPKGLHLRDEIGRFWRIAQAHWADFAHARVRAAEPALAATQFVQALLKEVFGFGTLQAQLPLERDGRLYPLGLNALDGRVPVVIAPAGLGLDKAHTQFGDGQRRRTAFGLLQEYLNATDAALWGMVSDGVVLRLARDNGSLTRPAWIEADLGRIFAEERFADFTALWLLVHESRFGRVGTLASECALENWRQAGQAEGVRARDHLRLGVEAAILELGQGFLAHPDNGALRAELQAGQLTPQGYFQELLRLVYRVIFLLTAEEREVLHPQEAEGYGVRRLRDRAVRRSALDRHTDLWQGLGITWRGLAHGEPVLGLPALGGLFASAQCPHLDNARLENRVLLGALFRLCWLREPSGLSRVNWRDMGPEELGSVYESLLELVPQIRDGGRIFAFGEGDETRGNARKVSGSYYTPDSLVQLLLDSALEPVIAQTVAAHPGQAAEALLRLSVLDPACGSGHFLLAAARRLAAHVARHAVDGTPTAADYRRALRQVVGNCLYGVDRNPMALELARTALWLEAMTPEAPLTFLDHHLVCGDALVGLQSLDVLKAGIPKEAFKALSGDDAAVVKRLAASNRNELKRMAQVQGGQLVLGLSGIDWVEALQRVEAMPDDSLDAIAAKQAATLAARQTGLASAHPQRLAADLYVTAFLAPKTAETERLIPTSATIGNALAGLLPNQEMLAFAEDLTGRMSVLHWPITFAHILARGGFDCVLGNPPWDMLQMDPRDFFASRLPEITAAQNMAARDRLISKLKIENPILYLEYLTEKNLVVRVQTFVHGSGRYPLTSYGRINLAPLFAEHALNIISTGGRAGLVLPTGIFTDSFTQYFCKSILENNRVVSIHDFENRDAVFPGVHRSYKFALLTLGDRIASTDYVFFATATEQLADKRRHFTLSGEDIALINPNTRTCPVFRSQMDAELTKKIYRRVPVLMDEAAGETGNSWGIKFNLMFMMNTDSHLFFNEAGGDRLPLYEAKLIHHYDHRWATYDDSGSSRDVTLAEKQDPGYHVRPRYWVARTEVESRLRAQGWERQWLLGWRDICRSTDERTVIASVLPVAGVGHTMPLFFSFFDPPVLACFIGNWSSLAFDFCTRNKIGGTHLTYSYLKQLPVLPPSAYDRGAIAFIVPRVLELTYTSHELKPWAEDLGYDGPSYAFDPERRAFLRAELDACYAHLYGLDRDELRYILDPADVMGADYPSETFRVLKDKELRQYGEYRTQRLVLAAWDRLRAEGLLGAQAVLV